MKGIQKLGDILTWRRLGEQHQMEGFWQKTAGVTAGSEDNGKKLIASQNKKERLSWAVKHHQSTTEDWKKVFWADESKFENF